MQMQFMQMMAGQNGGAAPLNGHMPQSQSMGSLSSMGGGVPGMMPGMPGMPGMAGMPHPAMMGLPGGGPDMRHSMVMPDPSMMMMDGPPSVRGDAHMRTMSMVQPSSASWIQHGGPGPQSPMHFAPSIRVQGDGYTPSIAPSERSNVGLPGRYRPVSHLPAPHGHAPVLPPVASTTHPRKSSMSGALRSSLTMTVAQPQNGKASGGASDDDDEEGWEAMKAKREKKKSIWRTKKVIGGDISAFIS